ncbi:GapA-binding peptide SR1P [Bacillus aerolatus]|uniref:GapA-binding peptide SR1P n=1 Tax=Bacillus aerolatus TaxID=2653354 RepID=A0A6I1FXM3_9BACI|nr:GapA-binding peptide SR1P [Bacillus aerolatus]KAB7707918.1 GapA-binding peptide SR1P [Bacillus aerolatus]
MGTIVCQSCMNTIEHFEDEKVSVLYSHCGCDEETELDD